MAIIYSGVKSEERLKVETLRECGCTWGEVAKQLGRSSEYWRTHYNDKQKNVRRTSNETSKSMAQINADILADIKKRQEELIALKPKKKRAVIKKDNRPYVPNRFLAMKK